jgi:hypothetical protein
MHAVHTLGQDENGEPTAGAGLLARKLLICGDEDVVGRPSAAFKRSPLANVDQPRS